LMDKQARTEVAPLDVTRARLRATLAAVASEISHLSAPSEALRSVFAELVTQLDLGPEPAMLACPHCGKQGLRIASLCGFCWKRRTPTA
jgi:hypothetical protein